jgi:hypothetical protein
VRACASDGADLLMAAGGWAGAGGGVDGLSRSFVVHSTQVTTDIKRYTYYVKSVQRE